MQDHVQPPRSLALELKCHMQKKNILRRRRLATAVRKRATSYYSEAEHRDIAAAAAREGVSLSSFIASAALKEARKTNTK
jgi:predicted HicB family RNase H-like nuclease